MLDEPAIDDADDVDDGDVDPASGPRAERAERLKAVVAPLAPYLRKPLTVETAHDLLLALSMLEVYRELRGRGWSDARYQAWLGRILREQLLASASPG